MKIEQKLEIEGINPAYKNLLKRLVTQGFQIVRLIPVNKGRYIIVKSPNKNIVIMFKRALFMNFGKIFRKQGQKGVGDSINVDDIKIALRHAVKQVYTIFPNGYAYSIPLTDILTQGIKWQNKEGKFVYSFSVHLYKQEFKL